MIYSNFIIFRLTVTLLKSKQRLPLLFTTAANPIDFICLIAIIMVK